MKVYYIYTKQRRDYYNNYIEGKGPDHVFYGLNHMKDFKINAEAELSDNSFKTPTKLLFKPLRLLYKYDVYRTLYYLNKFKKYDLLYFTGHTIGFTTLFLKYLKLLNIPIVCQCIGLGNILKRTSYLKIYKEVLSQADFITFCSKNESHVFENILKIPKNKLKFISPGVDTNFFKPTKIDYSGGYAFTASSVFNTGRDYDTFIKASSGLKIGFKVVLGGPNEYYIKKFKGTGIQTLSKESHLEMKKLYAGSKFVIIPLKDIEFAGGQWVLLEAMAMGKAIIVTENDSVTDYVKDWKTAIYVEPNNAEDMKDKMQYLLDNPKEIKRLGRNARKMAEKEYNTKQYAKKLSGVFWDVYDRND